MITVDLDSKLEKRLQKKQKNLLPHSTPQVWLMELSVKMVIVFALVLDEFIVLFRARMKLKLSFLK